ncbi:MAG: PadR family transcriptional regulator [Steroidobacteraceae bacterium]
MSRHSSGSMHRGRGPHGPHRGGRHAEPQPGGPPRRRGRDGFEDIGHRAGRLFGPGDLRLLLLALLAEQPRYGYELIKAIEEDFGGAYAPSPGSIYPTLTLLEETGLIVASAGDGNRRRYEASAAGRSHLHDNRSIVDAVRNRMRLAARAIAGQRPPEAIFQAMHTLKTALAMHGGGWDAAEVERVRALIESAATAIGTEARP